MSNEIKFKIVNDVNRVIKKKHFFSIYSKEATVKYLENMASKGWLLCKVMGNNFYFREIEPCKVAFDIHPFGNGITDTEYLGSDEQKYITECAKKEWKFVCEYDSIQFFYKIKTDVEPLEIDTKKIKDKIRDRFIKREFLLWIFLELIVCFLTMGMGYSSGNEKGLAYVLECLRDTMYVHIYFIFEFILCIIKYGIFVSLNKRNEKGIKYISQKTENIMTISSIALVWCVVIGYLISEFKVDIEGGKSSLQAAIIVIVVRALCNISEDKKFKKKWTLNNNKNISV